MRRLAVRLTLLLLGVLVASCAGGDSRSEGVSEPAPDPQSFAEPAEISGEVILPPDFDIPEGAVLSVQLHDVSLIDVSSILIAQQTLTDLDSRPIRFAIAYDAAEIAPRNRYSILAQIELDGRLIAINDTMHDVLTHGFPDHSDITLVRVE